jgi:hypothetical protein
MDEHFPYNKFLNASSIEASGNWLCAITLTTCTAVVLILLDQPNDQDLLSSLMLHRNNRIYYSRHSEGMVCLEERHQYHRETLRRNLIDSHSRNVLDQDHTWEKISL